MVERQADERAAHVKGVGARTTAVFARARDDGAQAVGRAVAHDERGIIGLHDAGDGVQTRFPTRGVYGRIVNFLQQLAEVFELIGRRQAAQRAGDLHRFRRQRRTGGGFDRGFFRDSPKQGRWHGL